MRVYGLTGGIGSGKSSVAALLESYGIPVVSADELSRLVVAKGSDSLADVVEAFGSEVLSADGELDRQAMAKIVFSDEDRRRKLESILHPRIRERYEQVLEGLDAAGHPVVVYEVPLLFEKKLQSDMHAVVLITAPAGVRIDRVCRRDGSSIMQVQARMAAQMPEERKRELADYVIENGGDFDDLRREVEILISRFFKLGGSGHVRLVDSPGAEARPAPAGGRAQARSTSASGSMPVVLVVSLTPVPPGGVETSDPERAGLPSRRVGAPPPPGALRPSAVPTHPPERAPASPGRGEPGSSRVPPPPPAGPSSEAD